MRRKRKGKNSLRVMVRRGNGKEKRRRREKTSRREGGQ